MSGKGGDPDGSDLSAAWGDPRERIYGDTESPGDSRAETGSVEAEAEGSSGDMADGAVFDRASAVWAASSEAIGLVREGFADTTDLIWMRSIAKESEPGADLGFEEFRRVTLLQSLGIRGTAYSEHTELILRGCLEPFDDESREVLGFNAREAWACTQSVNEVLSQRILDRLRAMYEEYAAAEKMLRRLRRKKQLPADVAKVSPSQQKAWLRWRIQGETFGDALELVTLTAAEISAHAGVDEAIAEAWFTALTCDPNLYDDRFHRQPCGAHPITRFPVLRVPGGFMVPAPTSLEEALRPLMENALREAGGDTWARYDHHRATWVERTATERIASVLPGSVSWTAVGWSSPDDSSDLDGLVQCDDFGARIQCKAGRVSAPARRGAPSMAEDIQAVINDGAHQHARLAHALATHKATDLGFTAAQADALAAPLSVEVVVCLDDVTVWSTETHKLRHLVALPDNPQVPWVLSLADLLVVTDLLQGVELVHYVTRRLRIEAEQKVEAHDELDWVGHYIEDGLFFDTYFEAPDAPDVYRLTTYTEFIDTWYFARAGLLSREIPRPQQELPAELRELLQRLERDRPRHWLIAGLLLLNGDDSTRRQLVELMGHRQHARKWSAAAVALHRSSPTTASPSPSTYGTAARRWQTRCAGTGTNE